MTMILSIIVFCFFIDPSLRLSTDHLTLEDRIEAQKAIDRVYLSHQEGLRRAPEEAYLSELAARKVQTYLGQSEALEQLWNIRISAPMLQAEVERLARDTRLPERLPEGFSVPPNDPPP